MIDPDCGILIPHWNTKCNSYLCLITNPTYFHGSAMISCVLGGLSCFGAKFGGSWSSLTMLTPLQLLCLIPINTPPDPNSELIVEHLKSEETKSCLNTISNLKNYSLVIFRPTKNIHLQICSKFSSCTKSDLYDHKFSLTNNFHNNYNILDDSFTHYDHVDETVLNNISKGVIIFAGSKDSGKSSLLRFCANRLLSNRKKVIIVDGDIGQSEFNPPGVISASVVTQPYFGATFNNQITPHISTFVGTCNCDSLRRYIDCLQFIMSCLFNSDYVILVNTMGYSTGLGILLMAHIIRICDPSFIVQLNQLNFNKNFPSLNEKFIKSFKLKINCNYKLIEINICGWRYKTFFTNFELRELSILSYLFKNSMLLPLSNLLLSSSPVSLSFSDISLSIYGVGGFNTEQYLMALNGTWVGLCKVDESLIKRSKDYIFGVVDSDVVSTCVGFGIIKYIDRERRFMHVITPETEETLTQVNLIYRGAYDFPISIRQMSNDLYISEDAQITGDNPLFRIY